MCKAIMKQQQQKVVIIQFANIESPVDEPHHHQHSIDIQLPLRVREICSCIVTYQLLADLVCKVLVGDYYFIRFTALASLNQSH